MEEICLPKERLLVFVAIAGLCTGFLDGSSAWAGVDIITPVQGAPILGNTVHLEIDDCKEAPELGGSGLLLNGQAVAARWQKSPYKKRWYTQLPLESKGPQRLELSGKCGSKKIKDSIGFVAMSHGVAQIAEGLAGNFMRSHEAEKLGWDWEDAVFLYGLERFRHVSESGAEAMSRYLVSHHRTWAKRGIPKVDRSDRCASALSALGLMRYDGDPVGADGVAAVAHYVRNEPRNSLDTINHLGRSWLSKIYPNSIWVDSLMMYGVFAAQLGRYENDRALLDFAAAQPLRFASVLQDANTRLLRHAWLFRHKLALPKEEAFWLRGNGLVLASVVEILEEIDRWEEQAILLRTLLNEMSDALLSYQLPDGTWDTMANLPGWAYAETSGSALVAFAWARGAHRGWLPPIYLEHAKRAFAGVSQYLKKTEQGYSMTGISGPTNATPKFIYKRVGRKADKAYGVGAYLLAAAELAQERFD